MQEAEERARSMAAMAEHVRKHKVVLLEELSSLFSMRTKDVIACLKQLEADGAISGVIDDRGKFICMHNTRPLRLAGSPTRRHSAR